MRLLTPQELATLDHVAATAEARAYASEPQPTHHETGRPLEPAGWCHRWNRAYHNECTRLAVAAGLRSAVIW